MTVTAPGLYPELSGAYFIENLTPTPYLSQSGIKTLLNETPFDYRNPTKRKSKEMDFGSICHALALGKGAKFAVSPFDDYRTKAAKEWREEQAELGLIAIKADAFADAQAIALVIQAKLERLFQGCDYITEVPFFWLEDDTWCGGMLDAWCPDMNLAADPKITSPIQPEGKIVRFGWDLQAAWYRRGLERIFPDQAGRIRFANILVKPDAPYTSRVIELNEAWRHSAETECLRALRIFQECTRTGIWPGYPDMETLDAPTWALRDRMMAEEDEE